MSTVITKEVYVSSGLNYFWLVYKSLHNFNVNIRTNSQGQIAGRTIKVSEDWVYDYMDYVSSEQSLAYIDITTTGAMSPGDKIQIDAWGSSTELFNPLEDRDVYASIYNVERSNDTINKWKVTNLCNDSTEWNFSSSLFSSQINKELEYSSNTLAPSMAAGSYSAWWTTSSPAASGDVAVFSVYITPSGVNKFTTANNGIMIEIDEYNGSGWDQYVSRCFIPSGKTEATRCSFAHEVQLTAPILRAGVYCTNTNTHGDSYDVLLSGYKFEILSNSVFPVKNKPTQYIGSGDFLGYEVRIGSKNNIPAYISNVSIEDGNTSSSSFTDLEKYNGDKSFNINHTNFTDITVLKNTANVITNNKLDINKPHYIKNGATVTMEFRYKANRLITTSGGGISCGYEEWSDIGTHNRVVELVNSISGNSNFDKQEYTFINTAGNIYVTPYIMISGCKGTIYIDDVKLYDRDLYSRTRVHGYDNTRNSYNLNINKNYINVQNEFREPLGGLIWQDEDDDVFIQDTITLDKAPNWDFIWRDSVYYYPYRNQYLEMRINNARANGGIEKMSNGLGGFITNGETLANLEAQWNYKVYNGFEDHAEEVEQTTYIDSITMDEDYLYILYHTNNILKTKNGSAYNKEFRSNPNRYYLAMGTKGSSDYSIIRLNDGLSRDISLKDGKFFTYPVFPNRNITGISWASGAMSNDGNVNHSLQTWRSQIHDIATHPNSAFVFYCGTQYWWDDQTSSASQTLKSANFIGAIPKSFPDTVGQLNVQIGGELGAIEKQYGVIIYTSGNSDICPSGLHPGQVELKRFVGLACTGELFNGADIHSLVLAESQGNSDTSVNLKLLTHTAYDDILNVKFGNFAYDGGVEEPEINYNPSNVNILDIMQVTDVVLPNIVYNGMINYPSGATITPFHLSYNDKNKMLYSYTRTLNSGASANKLAILKDFNQWSYENRYFYDGKSSQPINGDRSVLNVSLSGSSENVETYTFSASISGSSESIDKSPILAFFDYQTDYIEYVDGNRLINSEGTEQIVGNIKTLYRTSFQCDGQNIISRHADGSKGFKKQTEYINDAQFKEPVVSCLTNFGDEYILDSTPKTSGTFNNIKITKDYTINYLTGEVTYNKIPINSTFSKQNIINTSTNGNGYYSVLSGTTPSGAYDEELFIQYSNRYTIPFCWAADESVIEFLEKVSKADNSLATIDNEGNILYGPEDFMTSAIMKTNGYQVINDVGAVVNGLFIDFEKNEGSVKNPVFDEVEPTTLIPMSWSIKSYGNGSVGTTSNISKFSRRSASIISSGDNFIGSISSTPIKVASNSTYTASIYYNSFDIKNSKNYVTNNILLSGSLSDWTFNNSNVSKSISSRNCTKYNNSLKINLPANEEEIFFLNTPIFIDEYETMEFNLGYYTEDNNIIASGILIFTDNAGVENTVYTSSELNQSSNSYISVTGSSISTANGYIPNMAYPLIYISGGASDSVIYINDINISGAKGAGGNFNIIELSSSSEVLNIINNKLEENTYGFSRIIKTYTTNENTKYVVLEANLKNSNGVLLVDGVRNDVGDKSEDFVIGETVLSVSDFPIGATSFTKDYREGFDYLLDKDKSTINLVNNNIIQNGYFSDYINTIPNGINVSISGETDTDYPLLIKTSGGLFNDNSVGISFSGNGFAEIYTDFIPIDINKEYSFDSYYRVISGDSNYSSEYLTGMKIFHKIEYLDEEKNVVYISSDNEDPIIV